MRNAGGRHFEHVEADGGIAKTVFLQIAQGGAADAPLLGEGHALSRRAVRV